MSDNTILVDSFLAYTIGIIVYFVGLQLNKRVTPLREFNIPEPVTGGIIAALAALGLFLITGLEVTYELDTRDRLLVYFFTAIGINARVSDLLNGGRPLIILLVLTLGYIVFQDVVGVLGAQAIGQPNAVGILTGSASLIGGHGTSIAWAPEIAANHGVPNALEIGVASATLGLVLASLLGGPLMILLGLQTLAAVVFIIFIFFPLMGKDYFATVLSAGFAGFSLGATPTAIANMTAVTKSHGPAPTAFIILPLVGAFFVDITNAFVIQFFLGL